MGQVGLHGIFGLVVGEHLITPFVKQEADRRAVMFGFVFGNLAPDLDFLAVVSLFPLDPDVAVSLHRGFTHSLLGALAMFTAFWVGSLLIRDRYMRYMGIGLALGVMGHALKDLFLWFTPVDIFWPLSVYGVVPPINLWSWWTTPPLMGRLMTAAELAAFGLFYDYLTRLALEQRTNLDLVPTLQRMSTICWIAWVLQTALSLDLPETMIDMYLYIPMGLVFMPVCLYLTWRLQNTIEHAGVASLEKR